jgi:hypothetical protein
MSKSLMPIVKIYNSQYLQRQVQIDNNSIIVEIDCLMIIY